MSEPQLVPYAVATVCATPTPEASAKDVRVYSPDDCPDRSTLPNIW